MAIEVKVPSVGESVQEGVIYKWHKQSGDYINMDDVLVELETDKATVDIVAESSGVVETLKAEGDTVAVGDVIAKIDGSAAKPKTAAGDQTSKANGRSATAAPEQPAPAAKPSAAAKTGTSAATDTPTHLSPAVGRLVREHQIDPAGIAGSGRGGRLTKGDVLEHLESTSTAPSAKQAPQPAPSNKHRPAASRQERREKMSLLRKKIAERMLTAQSNAAILTTFNEVDMSAVMALRKQYKDSFKERHGINLGFMSFFVTAAIRALKEYPAINGWIEGEEIVYHDYYDIGVAVSSDRGLVVPVIRDADQLDFAGIEAAIAAYADKARAGKITVDDLSGGTFTISNGGVFGSLMSTPILNPPQSGILGMHKIEQRAVVIDGQIVARPMMYLALSYDHRIVDGKEAVSFLVKIKEGIEDPTRLLLGV